MKEIPFDHELSHADVTDDDNRGNSHEPRHDRGSPLKTLIPDRDYLAVSTDCANDSTGRTRSAILEPPSLSAMWKMIRESNCRTDRRCCPTSSDSDDALPRYRRAACVKLGAELGGFSSSTALWLGYVCSWRRCYLRRHGRFQLTPVGWALSGIVGGAAAGCIGVGVGKLIYASVKPCCAERP